MAHIYNAGYAVVDADPNGEATLQSGHQIKIASLDDGTKVWKFVAGNSAGTKWVEILSPTGLEALDEGNGVGWRLIGKPSANYANTGFNSVDMHNSSQATGLNGSAGDYSAIVGGSNQKAGANYSGILAGQINTIGPAGDASVIVGGQSNTVTGADAFQGAGNLNNISSLGGVIVGGNTNLVSGTYASIGGGQQNIASGDHSTVPGGFFNYARSFGEVALGINGTDYTPASTTAYDATDRIFNVGNGTLFFTPSDAFTILKGGEIFAPSLSNTKIDAATGDVLVTKDWVGANTGSVASVVAGEGIEVDVTDAANPIVGLGGTIEDEVEITIVGTVAETENFTMYGTTPGTEESVVFFAPNELALYAADPIPTKGTNEVLVLTDRAQIQSVIEQSGGGVSDSFTVITGGGANARLGLTAETIAGSDKTAIELFVDSIKVTTPAVHAATATVGQVLALSATDGEVEFITPAAGATKYNQSFVIADWTSQTITITAATHGAGTKPMIQVFDSSGNEVSVNKNRDASGNVTLTVISGLEFDGEVTIL